VTPDRATVNIASLLMTSTSVTRVAVIEDLKEIREGLGQLINATPGFRCSGIYPSMEDALEKIPNNLPNPGAL
jgi:hypothetical protein